MTWRILRVITGRHRPAAPPEDLEEAKRHRLEAEHELRHTRRRGRVVREAVAAFDYAAADTDLFAALIEEAFGRKGRGR